MVQTATHPKHPSLARFWQRIAWLEPFWLALLTPAILLPGRFWDSLLQPALVLALFLFWPLRRLAYGRWTLPSPLNGPMLVLLAWTPVTVAVAIEKSRAVESAGYLLLGIALYAGLVNWPPARRRPALLAWPVVAVGVALVVLGPQIMTLGMGSRFVALPALETRMGLLIDRVGEDINPNVLAGALVLTLPFLAALAMESRWTRRFWWPLAAGLPALLGVLPLVLTQSRGAMVAIVVALLLLLVLRLPQTAWGLPLVAAGLAYLFQRFGWQAILDGLSSNTSLVGLSGRLEIWDRAAHALRDFAWTGVGHGLFAPVVPWLYPFFTMPGDIPHAHNLLLQVGIDMGIPGILAYLGVLIAVFYMAGKTLQRAAQRRARYAHNASGYRRHTLTWALSAGLLAAYTGMVVHGVVDAVTWGTKLAFLPWLCYALTAGLYVGPRRRRRRRRRSAAE
jgi:putative inorganic carbon (HCO3(-)) transporter